MEKWKLDASLFRKNLLRDPYIDALKGIAILLVVIGHAIQTSIPDFDNNIMFRIIYSFHMPLFMFLSGYVIYGRIGSPISIWLIDKFKRLVIPFLSWAIVISTFYDSDSFVQYFLGLYKHPDTGLWFLWVLFLNYCIIGTLSLFGKQLEKMKLLLMMIIIDLIPIGVLGFPWVKWLFPFFVTGYILAGYKDKPPQWIRTLSLSSSCVFPFLVYFWYRTKKPSFIQDISEVLTRYGVSGISLGDILTKCAIPNISLVELSYRYIVAFAGISLVAQIIKGLEKFKLFLLLSWLGTCTMDIYVSHKLFLYGIGDGTMRVITSVVISLSLSLVLSFCLRQSKILSMLFLGLRYSNK